MLSDKKTDNLKKRWIIKEEKMLPYWFLTVCACAFFNPAAVWASEDSTPYLFGGEINYETALAMPDYAFGAEDNAGNENIPSVEEDGMAEALAEDDKFAPPPSDYIPMPSTVPEIPVQQTPINQAEKDEGVAEDVPQINKEQTLTDNLKEVAVTPKEGTLPLPNVEGTWVDKLANTNPLSLLGSGEKSSADDSLSALVDKARRPSNGSLRSNASVFDISGIMLRMSLQQVEETMRNRGFRKMMEKYQIPNFIKWRNEEYCRNSGVVGYERTEACVTQKAKKDKHEYVQVVQYSKFDTKEEMEITLTSNFTDNKVYKIKYKSMAANVTGNSPKAMYLRNIKVYDFWKKINQKYGKPDNKTDVTWGMGGNKPFLKAGTGFLQLEDPMLRELDYTRMSREDQRYMNTDLYSF